MQERGTITNMDLKVYLGNLKNNPRFTEEMLRLVEEDLKFGLTPKETEEYTGKKLDYAQMKVYSRCLRNGYGKDAIEVITGEGLSGEQMAVALEFYEKGVPVDTMREVIGKAGQTAFAMKKLFQNVMEKLGAVDGADAQETYARELIRQVREAVEKISFQEKRFDALNEKLKELGTAGQDARVQDGLLSQLSEKDRILQKQLDEINAARATIARLRGGLEKAGQEKRELEKKLQGIGLQEKAGGHMEPYKGKGNMPEPHMRDAGDRARMPLGTDYQAALIDQDGSIVRLLQVERAEPRKNKGMLTSLFSRACLKKKADIVRMVAEEGLEPKQLVQVRSAIEKGLTEKQLMVLIDRRIPAEHMEEIINIAVYENGHKEG